jgi:CelD/BcsL family acetyltransferase involved in cellulose biosynthesis
MPTPMVTVITAHGQPLLKRGIESVRDQDHAKVQHPVVADGPATWAHARAVLDAVENHWVSLIRCGFRSPHPLFDAAKAGLLVKAGRPLGIAADTLSGCILQDVKMFAKIGGVRKRRPLAGGPANVPTSYFAAQKPDAVDGEDAFPKHLGCVSQPVAVHHLVIEHDDDEAHGLGGTASHRCRAD